MKTSIQKDYNTEVLRIILMVFIIMHHLILNGIGMREITTNTFDKNELIYVGVNAYFIVAVNVFFIISGYYGIKFNIKKMIKLCLVVYFYYIIINSLFVLVGLEKINIHLIKNIIFPISSYWFIFVYLILCICSLGINIMLKYSSQQILKKIILALTLIFSFYGFLIENATLGINRGYSLMFAMYLYLIGYYIKEYYVLKKNKLFLLLIYLVSCTINGLLCMTFVYFNKGEIAWQMFNYNNPLVLIGAISLFLLFRGIQIKESKALNTISLSVFSIYIIHSTPILSTYIYSYFNYNYIKMYGVSKWIYLIGYCGLIFGVCCILELIRRKMLDKMFYRIADKIYKVYYKLKKYI